MVKHLIFIRGKWCVFKTIEGLEMSLRLSYQAERIYEIGENFTLTLTKDYGNELLVFTRDEIEALPILHRIIIPPRGSRALVEVYASRRHLINIASQGYSMEELFAYIEEQIGKFDPDIEDAKVKWLEARKARREADRVEMETTEKFGSLINY